MKEIVVSIVCNTYNHEKYIRNALNSFINQQTNFGFEVLVHDDASTDHTADIIREFEAKYPDVIKPIYETENQYSKHNGTIARLQYGRVKGAYIAFCEGDDYWTDPLKLQKQYDAMEAHPEVDICAHRATQMDAKTGKKMFDIAPANHNCIIPVSDVIMGGGGYVSTNSLFYRAELEKNIPLFRQQFRLDYTTQIHGSLRGGMLFLNDNMSVYRFLTEGSWSSKQRQSVKLRNEHLKKMQDMLSQLDIDTFGLYTDVIQKRMLKNEFNFFECNDECKMLLNKKYSQILKEENIMRRVKVFLKAYFPFIYKIKRKILGTK